jgi:hypothetical protein
VRGQTRIAVVLLLGVALGAAMCGCGGGKGAVTSLAPDEAGVKTSRARKEKRRRRKLGSVRVTAVFPPRALSRKLAPSGTTHFQVVLWGPGLPEALSAVLSPGYNSTTFRDVPVGEKFVRADAYGSADNDLDVNEFLGFGVTRVVAQANLTTQAQVQTDVTQRQTDTVTGTQVVNGVPVHRVDGSDGNATFFRLNVGNAVELHGEEQDGSTSGGTFLHTFTPPQRFPLGLRVGQSSSQTVTEAVNGVPTGQTTFNLAVQGVESIIVPAGKFDALRVQVRATGSIGDFTKTLWLVPNLGRVMTIDFNGNNIVDSGVLLQANVPSIPSDSPDHIVAEHFPVFDVGNTFTAAWWLE